ncbi:MAG: hypothetical protein LCH51_07835 [Bacteroidetes bacterium]|nr:hypothetical protein [Bacteroidota bacterium]
MDTTALDKILKELKASKQITAWPDHAVAQAGLVANAADFLLNASFRYKYNRKTGEARDEQIETMKRHALQTAVMSIRFLENIDQ